MYARLCTRRLAHALVLVAGTQVIVPTVKVDSQVQHNFLGVSSRSKALGNVRRGLFTNMLWTLLTKILAVARLVKMGL